MGCARPACVVLPGEARRGIYLEIAALAAEAPEHIAARAADGVERPGVAGREEKRRVIRAECDRVEMEIVERFAGDRRAIGLVERDAADAAPVHEDVAGGDVDLLDCG